MDLRKYYIDIAYQHFAEFGPDQFTFGRIAAESGIPFTALLKHFRNINNLMDDILEKHYQDIEIFNAVCKKQCKIYNDIHKLLMQYSTGFKFHIQLFRNKDYALYDLVYIHTNHLFKDLLVPLFMDYYEFEMPLLTAEIMWLDLVDRWYSRLDVDNFNVELLQQKTDDLMHVMLNFKNSLN